MIYVIYILFLSKIFTKKKQTIKNEKDNILIDTFVVTNNLKVDNYYNNIKNKLKNKKNIFFVPTIVHLSIFKLPGVIKQLRNNNNFILIEDFINLSDIFFAFNYPETLIKHYS